jgi:hypothetical protein
LSDRYTDRLATWAKGGLDTLLVPRTPTGLPPGDVRGRIRLVPR